MPRRARVLLPGTPHHIVQRGHNRNIVFNLAGDFELYLKNLSECSVRFDVKVHSYCLMPNHVHLILEPQGAIEGVSLLMKRLAGRQCRYVNRIQGRSGSLWEGRFKSSPIERDRYLLACCRYVELNPVKANIVVNPADYPWSSYSDRINNRLKSWMGEDVVLGVLSNRPKLAARKYKELISEGCPDQDFIQQTTDRNQLLGDADFVSSVEKQTGEEIGNRKPGRPKNRSVPAR